MFQQARKRPMVEWGFTRFNRLFLKAHFANIQVEGPSSIPSKRTLFLINHSTWWDSLIIFHLNDKFVRSDGYGMMHEEGIRRFPFFRSIGAYSVNASDRRHLLKSLRYSLELLQRGSTVWIFPQGEEQHLEKRPLQFFSGVSYLAEKCPSIDVVPVSLYYSLEHTRKPNAYIKIGDPLDKDSYAHLDRKSITEHFEMKMTDQMDELKKKVINEQHDAFIKI
ncbi:lysophospholipid acyltransferase family protein [Halobacillus sp. H74]|uniref:lysophospholipid acyltransferase family protein n=1 Tax=Halobacillus sp. H74 TaxID=3457436 RepID=UPI003FCE0F3C